MRKCVSAWVCVYHTGRQGWLARFPGELDIINQILKKQVGVSQISWVEKVFTLEATAFAISEKHVRIWSIEEGQLAQSDWSLRFNGEGWRDMKLEMFVDDKGCRILC